MKIIDKKNSILKNIFLLLKPYKNKIFISLFLSIIITILTTLSPLIAQRLIDKGIMPLNIHIALKLSLTIIILTTIEKFLSLYQSILHIDLRNKLYIYLQLNMLKKIFTLKINKFKESGFQSIFDSINFDIDTIAEIADKNFLLTFMEIFKVVGGLVSLGIINPKLTFFILFLIPIKSFVTNFLSKLKVKLFNALVISFEDIGQWCEEILNGIREIKLWNLYSQKEFEYKQLLLNKTSLEKRVQILDNIDDFSGNILEEIILNLIYILGVVLALKEDITVGGIITFTMYSNIITSPLSSLISIKYKFANIKPSIENYCDFLNQDEECLVKELLPPNEVNKIIFKDVYLNFDNKIAMKNINLEFNKGEKIAFIGTNGSGKSSILNLLLRFYSPSKGTILFNDINIAEINLTEYRALFSVVSQNTYLFNRSIKDNIDLYNQFTEEEIMNYCDKHGILHFINFLNKSKDGINSKVGMNGDKLSGGESQKISLLRALLKDDRKILILDEATANYDIESEKIFNNIIANCTLYDFVFIISHRPEILKHMDKIVLLDKGEIKCVDNYDYIVKNNLFKCD